MNGHTPGNTGRRFAWATTFLVALVGTGACDTAITDLSQTPFEAPADQRLELHSSVTPPWAGVGEQVLVSIDFVGSLNGTPNRARVEWDPSRFEYVQPLPPESSRYLDQDLIVGTMSIDAELAIHPPKSRITLIFRALVNTSTAGIMVSAQEPAPLR